MRLIQKKISLIFFGKDNVYLYGINLAKISITMKISIIVPVYNVEDYILSCLQSVANQIWDGDIECLIIDDCGSDNSIQIAEQFINEYSGPIEFSLIHREANGGLSAARNTGLDITKGDYIMFLDSDDELLPFSVANLAKQIVEYPYDIVVAPFIDTKNGQLNNHMTEGVTMGHKSIFRNFIDAVTTYNTQSGWNIAVWDKLYSKKLIDRISIRFPDGLLYEDTLWTFIIMNESQSAYAITTPVLRYRIRENSIITSTKSMRAFENTTKILSLINKYCDMKEIQGEDIWRFRFNRNNVILKGIYHDTANRKECFYRLLDLNPLDLWYGLKHHLVPTSAIVSQLFYSLPKRLGYYYWVLYKTIAVKMLKK